MKTSTNIRTLAINVLHRRQQKLKACSLFLCFLEMMFLHSEFFMVAQLLTSSSLSE